MWLRFVYTRLLLLRKDVANVGAAFSNLKKTINDDWRIESIFVSLKTIINDLDWWIHVQRRENLPAWIDITISQAFSRYRDGWDESSSSSTCNGEEGSQSQSLNHCCTWRSVQLSVDGPNNKARSAASRVDQIPGSKITGFNWQVFFYLFSCRYLHVWIFWEMSNEMIVENFFTHTLKPKLASFRWPIKY